MQIREEVDYRLKSDHWQNLGDYLSEYLLERLLLHVARSAFGVRLIGNYLDDEVIARHSSHETLAGHADRKVLLSWAGGMRRHSGLSKENLAGINVLSARGPLTSKEIGLADDVPIGDPVLILPALYDPALDKAFQGRAICVPSLADQRPDSDILATTGADLVLRCRIHGTLNAVERFIDSLTSAEFVLCGSLYAAILAVAYDKPFAFLAEGRDSADFEWEDFAQSIGIPCEFCETVATGRLCYRTSLRESVVVPSIWGTLARAPFPIRSEALLRILQYEIDRSGQGDKFDLGNVIREFALARPQQDQIVREQSALIESLVKQLEANSDHLGWPQSKPDSLPDSGQTKGHEPSPGGGELSSLHQYTEQVVDDLYRAYRRPWQPVLNALWCSLLRLLLHLKPVLPKSVVDQLQGSLLKSRPFAIRQDWAVFRNRQGDIASASRAGGSNLTVPSNGKGQTIDIRSAFDLLIGASPIRFEAVAEPDVSIIVPSFRDAGLLNQCLGALLAFRQADPSFEVILIDDCPDDRSVDSIPDSPGLVKIFNEENLGYLRSCNKAGTRARGNVICLLNSDAIVTTGWLENLQLALRSSPSIGIAGGMLLEPDGSVQDLGWQVTQDGWGDRIGIGARPDDPALEHRREVDCVTGACMAIERDLWESLRGFSEKFAPAYYEEFDFCFRARQAGKRTVSEPKCRVFHLGNASYSSDTRVRLALQNHKLFVKRHRRALRGHGQLSRYHKTDP